MKKALILTAACVMGAAAFALSAPTIYAATSSKQAPTASQVAAKKARLETKLSTAVTEGKISADQKVKIEAKLAELHAAHEAARATTYASKADRKTAHEKMRADLEKWATDNGIDSSLLKPGKGPRGEHRGPR